MSESCDALQFSWKRLNDTFKSSIIAWDLWYSVAIWICPSSINTLRSLSIEFLYWIDRISWPLPVSPHVKFMLSNISSRKSSRSRWYCSTLLLFHSIPSGLTVIMSPHFRVKRRLLIIIVRPFILKFGIFSAK